MINKNDWYNQKEGILTKLDTLENFFELLKARKIAYQRKEVLDEFYVLNAAFFLDQFGQCGRCLTPQLQQIIQLPVITEEELWVAITNYNVQHGLTDDFEFSITIQDPPYPGINCPECGKSWDINNLTDYIKMEHVRKKFEAGEFVGKPLKTMWEAYTKKSDAEYHAPFDHRVYNPKNINNSPNSNSEKNEYGFIPDEMGKTDPEYILQEGDMVGFWTIECFHKKCLHTYLDRKALNGFREIFKKSGFQKYELKPIPNEYEGCQNPNCTKCAAWFLVTTEHGMFKIGWRKRVIEITWPKGQNFLPLFMEEDVTKKDSFIHAWGGEKATEYLSKIKQECCK